MIRKVPHVHVSEREVAHTWPTGQEDDARWEDCRYVAAVEWLRAIGVDIPATLSEAEAIRQAAGQGPTGGSTLWQLARGVKARYGVTLPEPVKGASEIVLALTRGRVAMVDGRLANFPAGHRLRRWDPPFTGGHTVYVERRQDGSLWWCDPLAPVGTYSGEVVTDAELRTYASWTYSQAVIGTVALVEEEQMAVIAYKEELWDAPQGLPFYDAPNGRQLGTLAKAATIRTLGAPLKPDKTPDWSWRAGLVGTGQITGTMDQFVVWYPRGQLANPRLPEPPKADCADEVAAAKTEARGAALEEARKAAVEAVARAIEALPR